MPQAPHVSILILTCNGLADTVTCLRSLRPDITPETEVLLLDNGSQADEREALQQEFGQEVRIFRSDTNLGFAGGNNLLATYARGDLLIFLNNDTEVTPGWITPLLRELADPAVAACQPKLRSLRDRSRFDSSGGSGGFLDALGFHYVRGHIYAVSEVDRGQYDDAIDIDWAGGAAFAVRRKLFQDIGGFDAALFAYMEEIDLSWRLRARGYRIRCAPASLVFHKGGMTLQKHPTRKRFLGHRNNLLMLVKNLPFLRLVLILPLRFLLEFSASLYYLYAGQWSFIASPILSCVSFLLHLPQFLLARRAPFIAGNPRVFSIVWEYFFRGHTMFADFTPTRAR